MLQSLLSVEKKKCFEKMQELVRRKELGQVYHASHECSLSLLSIAYCTSMAVTRLYFFFAQKRTHTELAKSLSHIKK
jgi:hypothetical protein